MPPYCAKEQSQIRELPRVTGHLVDQRALAVHDFVVRQRQHEILGERIPDRERQPVVVVAGDRPGPARSSRACRASSPCSTSGRTRGRRYTGRETIGHAVDSSAMTCTSGWSRYTVVELAQERDRVEVLLAAVRVGNPLAGLARVVEVEHRRDGVHAQAVDVIACRARTARSRARNERTSWRP